MVEHISPGLKVIKLFFNLSSAEHEIFSAHKCQNQWKIQVQYSTSTVIYPAHKCWHFNTYKQDKC